MKIQLLNTSQKDSLGELESSVEHFLTRTVRFVDLEAPYAPRLFPFTSSVRPTETEPSHRHTKDEFIQLE
jgi:hypothetical protein